MRDDQLTSLLRSLDRNDEPDPVFADDLFRHLSASAGAQARGRRRSPLLLLAAALLVIVTVGGGAALGSGLIRLPGPSLQVVPPPSSRTPTPTPSASPSTASVQPSASPSDTASASPSPEPTARVTAPDGILPPGSNVTVLVNGLQLRREPSIAAPVVGVLAQGDTLRVVHAATLALPVIADGLSWYAIETPTAPEPFAWAAAAEGDTDFLALDEPSSCADLQPGTVTLEQLIAAGSWHRLACLGDTPVTVTGVYVSSCQGGAQFGQFQPAWLVDWCPTQVLTPQDGAKNFPTNGLATVAAPSLDGAIQPPGTIARVTGHFDDPASTGCVFNGGIAYDNGWTVWPGGATLVCREQFVVTQIEVLGSVTLAPTE